MDGAAHEGFLSLVATRPARATGRSAHPVGAATLALATLVVMLQPVIDRQYERLRYDDTPLFSHTVGLLPDGRPVRVTSPGARFLDATRVLDPGPGATPADRAAAGRRAAEQTAWLRSGTVPGQGTRWAPMVTSALLDLRTLTGRGGAVVAGWTESWRYVWPRDSAFVVAALSRTGHPDDAAALLRFLQGVQHRDGTFEARYLPDASGPPDGRGIQLDGSGWVLWAVDRWAEDLQRQRGSEAARGGLDALRPLIERSTAAALAAIETPSGLPPASPDYWEMRESRTTLGTAAPLAAGLAAAGRLYARLGEPANAARASGGAQRLSGAIARTFGRTGYRRYPSGGPSDAAVAFLLPPFARGGSTGPVADIVRAWHRTMRETGRPAGGFAPGSRWRADGASWTPVTSVHALVAAHTGDLALAEQTLDWLDRHRTSAGSLPEKVLHDGSPAWVAPLTWPSAAVILTIDALGDEHALP